jgi:hypothetical protein
MIRDISVCCSVYFNLDLDTNLFTTVTIQEPGWESFSEDEAPPPTKPKTASSSAPAPAAKPKKGGPKGQGSIMSFFSKK